MNSAYKHLDARLRLAGLALGQWVAVGVGVILAIVWGKYLSPFSHTLTFFTSFYMAGLPVTLALVANQSDFDVWIYARSWWRWRAGHDRYPAGPGPARDGYVLDPPPEPDPGRAQQRPPILDFQELWS